MPASQLRLIVVTEKAHTTLPVFAAFGRQFDVTPLITEGTEQVQIAQVVDYMDHDAVVFFTLFRNLAAGPPVDWGGYSGPRLLYDEDAWQFCLSLGFGRPNRAWPETFARHGFDALLCTGKEVSATLELAGVSTYWWPKAYEPRHFFDLGKQREGMCHFGTLYVSRQAMLHRLRRDGISVDHIEAPYAALNDRLNEYRSLIVGTLSNGTRTKLHRALRKLNPEWGLRLAHGPEPMLKLFEGAGAGCAVFCDALPELEDLGFIDGQTVVTWTDFDELVEKCHAYLGDAPRLREIAQAGLQLCATRHTWDTRMKDLDTFLRGWPAR